MENQENTPANDELAMEIDVDENVAQKRPLDEEAKKSPKRVKKNKVFSAKIFRKQLTSDEKHEAVKSFLTLLNQGKSYELVLEYLESGGSCQELLQCLEGASTIPPVVVFELVNIILLQISANLPQYHNQAYENCRYFLNTYISIVNKMIGLSSSGRERVVVLRLLTAIVTFSAALGKEILIHTNFNITNLELITKHTDEANNARDAFILFLTAFLVDGQYPTLSVLLEKRGMLTSIISGLKYDNSNTVTLVLTAMKNHILECPFVSKTAKMKTFNTAIVRDVVNLYNWKGPSGFKAEKNSKIALNVDEVEKSKVSEAVHNFLLVLCTSHKFGVIFKDPLVGLGKKNHNNLMYTVLESLERPWEHSYASDLVKKICQACPDLVKTMWSNLKVFIEPRMSQKWLNAMKFSGELLDLLTPSCVEGQLKELPSNQMSQIVTILVAPLPILKTLLTDNFTYDENALKYQILVLICKILDSLKKFVEHFEKILTQQKMSHFKSEISNYIIRNFPTPNNVLNDWENTEKIDETDVVFNTFNFTKFEYLQKTFDVFEGYKILAPNILDNLSNNVDLGLFLNNLTSLGVENDNELQEIDTKSKEMLKNIQTASVGLFFECNSNLFKPTSKLFTPTLGLLLEHYYTEPSKKTLQILRNIIKNTGIFDENTKYKEIDIWINGILNLKKYDSKIATFLADVLVQGHTNLSKYVKQFKELNKKEETLNSAKIIENLLKDTESSFEGQIKNFTLSPLVLTLSDVLNDLQLSRCHKYYLNFVILNLIFTQSDLTLVKEILKNNNFDFFDFSEVCKKNVVLPNFENFGRLDVFQNMINAFEIDDCENINNFQEENDLKIYPNLWQNLQQLTMFIFNKIIFGEQRNGQIEFSCEMLFGNAIYEKKIDLEIIFSNPVLFENFFTSGEKSKLATEFLNNLTERLTDGFSYTVNDILPFTEPYCKKLEKTLLKILEKSTNFKPIDPSIMFFNYGFRYEQCVNLLDKFDPSEDCNVTTLITLAALEKMVNGESFPYKKAPLERKLFEKILGYFAAKSNACPKFCEVILLYLNTFPHSYEYINEKFVLGLLNIQEFNKKIADVIAAIVLNRPDFEKTLQDNLELFLKYKGLTFTVLAVLPEKSELQSEIFSKIEPQILKALQKPQKAGPYFETHIDLIITLLKQIGDMSKLKTMLEKVQKFETTEIFHSKLISHVFIHFLNESTNEKWVLNSFLTLLHMQMSFLKRFKETDDEKLKLQTLSEHFGHYLDSLLLLQNDLNFTIISTNETLKQYVKMALRLGLSGNLRLLETIPKIVQILQNSMSPEDAKLIFDMLLSHSEFLNIVLNEHTDVKTGIMRLWGHLVVYWPKFMERNHVPVLLAAYRATLVESDKIILDLLHLYEKNVSQTHFHDFKPFLWGKTAANHYSVRSDLQKALFRQPKMGDVLDILNETLIQNTIKSEVGGIDILNCGEVKSLKEGKKGVTQGNALGPEVNRYDLSFLLPLFSHLLAHENVVQTFRFTRSGALALTVLGLLSDNKDVKGASLHVLGRLHFHLEARQGGKDNLLWIRYIEAICKSLQLKTDSETFTLNSFSVIFLARAALILSQPNHVMYLPLSQYLTSKSVLDLSTIPELYTFLHSSDVNFKDHRSFVLEVIRDGLRSHHDFGVLNKSMGVKLFTELYSSSVCDLETKLLILEILDALAKNSRGLKSLCEVNSLLPKVITDLDDVLHNPEASKHVQLISKLVHVLNNISVNLPVDFLFGKLLIANTLTKLLVLNVFKNLSVKSQGQIYDTLTTFTNIAEVRRILLTANVNVVNDEFCNYLDDYGTKYFNLKDISKDCEGFLYSLRKFYFCLKSNVDEKNVLLSN